MRAFGLLVLLSLAVPAAAYAQAGSCRLDQDASGTVTRTEASGGIITISGVVIRCAGGAEIRANEGNIFQASQQSHLFGNVQFIDGAKRLTSHNAIYSSSTGRLHATGDVVFVDREQGATLRGPDVEYYRAMPGRPEPQVIATMRPTLTVEPEPRDGQPQEPLQIDGDRITIIGGNLTASGNAIIRRPDMTATANEAFYDRDNGRLNLTGRARMTSDRFDLAAHTIESRLPDNRLEQVVARTQAVLTGDDLRVDAPEIRLAFADDRLQRLIARRGTPAGEQPAPQPVATSREFVLRGDSLDATLPEQRLEQVVAVGDARGETRDTLAAASGASAVADGELALDQNWILGDTITGYFEPPPVPEPGAVETTGESAPVAADTAVVLRRIVAAGGARSLYHVEPRNDQAANGGGTPRNNDNGRRALNYLAGDRIDLTFAGGEVDVAEVDGLQQGIYLDPVQTPASPAPIAGPPPEEPPSGQGT